MPELDADHRPPGYPAQWEADVVLADGGVVHVRPIVPDDFEGHRRFFAALSDDSRYYRFFGPRNRLTDREVTHFCTVDYHDRFALVAMLDGEIIAVARYDRLRRDDGRPGEEAEVAFVIADSHQGRGLGTLLLEYLAEAARTAGIDRFVAEVLAENRRMLRVFRDAGYELLEHHSGGGVVHVEFGLAATDETRHRIEWREHEAEERSMARLLNPASVALIGADHEPGTIGYHLFQNLLGGGFEGPVYPVSRSNPHVASVPAYPSIAEVPGPVDLAVVAVPAAAVVEVVQQCGAKGVGGLVVISAGFAETGPEGAERERQLLEAARAGGMRLVGPNCMGVVNTAIGLDATFAPVPPRPGRVAFMSQSGALGIAVLEWTARLGIGISSFVSVGNKADVSGNDLLQYWEDDDGTDLILLYLESFGNPRKFNRLARRISARKPIIAVKSGRTAAGTAAASSHTAAAASPEAAVAALFHQAGIMRVDTLEELFDLAQVVSSQPVPVGRRVAIVGNSGGPGILATDACVGAGLEMAELADDTQASLRELLGPNAAVSNPVDMVASAAPLQYEQALRIVLADAAVDSVIVIFTPPLVTRADDVAEAVARAAEAATKPVVANFLASREVPEALRGGGGRRRIPSFPSPEPAAIALARYSRHGVWRRRDPGRLPDLDTVDREAAGLMVSTFLERNPDGGWLGAAEAAALLGAWDVPVLTTRVVADAAEAVAASTEVGFPVALKVADPGVVHKTEVGGVRLGLTNVDEVREAFEQMRAALADQGRPDVAVGVQAMVPAGVETIVGVAQDASFGPLVMFGMGGVTTELLADRAFRLPPLTDTEVRLLVRSLRASPLLFGYRGAPAVDVARLERVVSMVAAMADETPELAELDLNPLIVGPRGVWAVDAKVRLRPAPTERPPVRAMRDDHLRAG